MFSISVSDLSSGAIEPHRFGVRAEPVHVGVCCVELQYFQHEPRLRYRHKVGALSQKSPLPRSTVRLGELEGLAACRRDVTVVGLRGWCASAMWSSAYVAICALSLSAFLTIGMSRRSVYPNRS